MSHAEVTRRQPHQRPVPTVPAGAPTARAGYDGASRLVLLDPIARGVHASLTALASQLSERGTTVPTGVTNGDLVLAMRDTAELRGRLCRTRGATFPAEGNPAVSYYLQEIVRLADTSAHARRAFLPGYDALAADIIRLTVVSSCRDPQGLDLAVAYEPGNVEIALEVISNPSANRQTISKLVERWVAAGTTAPDEKRLAVARAVIDARGRDEEISSAVTDGCMDMVLHYDMREIEAAYEAARTAVQAQVACYRPQLEELRASRARTLQRLAQVRAEGGPNVAREVMSLEMSADAMAEIIKEMALAEELPKLLESARAGKRLRRREMKALRRSGMLR